MALIDPAIPTQSGQTILPEAQRGTPAKPLVSCLTGILNFGLATTSCLVFESIRIFVRLT